MDHDLQPARDLKAPTRAELEKRLLAINAEMAALTPDAFAMPDNRHIASNTPSALQARIKKNELVLPDTEVLRQLLLEKARIAEAMGTLPHRIQGTERPPNDFSLKAEKPTLR
ncbi:hypothetical protein HYV43_04090 [Candidatus Micrarchaeota archaeon]|nr:hypothetical protein [Candidatus Micrarchaeota archaeon]